VLGIEFIVVLKMAVSQGVLVLIDKVAALLIALCNSSEKIGQPALNRAEIRDLLLCGLIKSPKSHLCQRHEWVKTVGRALHDVRLSGSLASLVNSPAYFS